MPRCQICLFKQNDLITYLFFLQNYCYSSLFYPSIFSIRSEYINFYFEGKMIENLSLNRFNPESLTLCSI